MSGQAQDDRQAQDDGSGEPRVIDLSRRRRLRAVAVHSAIGLIAVVGIVLTAVSRWSLVVVAPVAVFAIPLLRDWKERQDEDDWRKWRESPAPDPDAERLQEAALRVRKMAQDQWLSWYDQVHEWLVAAPLVELPDAPRPAADDSVEVTAGGVRYEVVATALLAGAIFDDIVAAPGYRHRVVRAYTFAWTPFPADYARSIVRVYPVRVIGSVHRTADGHSAVAWEPPGATGGAS